MTAEKINLNQQRAGVDQARQILASRKSGMRSSEAAYLDQRLLAAADTLAWLQSNEDLVRAAIGGRK